MSIATATAEGLRSVANALGSDGGAQAMQLRIAEQYIKEFGQLARDAKGTLIVPANLADISSMISIATSVIQSGKQQPPATTRG